ncbi:MAG TPA: hypothetical protein VEK15_10410, partial [Vicinamibacteria bacterium]|nr:hypothetical protein [Vicinamibacteria bacterium]
MSQRRRNQSNIWRTTGKRLALAVVAAIVALTWSQTGYAVAPCVIGRGLDPLDVLNADVRHNVWLVLDTSGSMGTDFDPIQPGTQSRISVARDVLTEVVNELVDATGRPLFNWGIVGFGPNSPNNTTACSAQFTNNCVGLDLNNLVNPPACDEPDNKTVILNR